MTDKTQRDEMPERIWAVDDGVAGFWSTEPLSYHVFFPHAEYARADLAGGIDVEATGRKIVDAVAAHFGGGGPCECWSDAADDGTTIGETCHGCEVRRRIRWADVEGILREASPAKPAPGLDVEALIERLDEVVRRSTHEVIEGQTAGWSPDLIADNAVDEIRRILEDPKGGA